MIVDKPLSELREYRPSLTARPDFDDFWNKTLAESAAQPLNPKMEEQPYPVERITLYKVTYDGFGPNTPITGWYLVPKPAFQLQSAGKVPTIVQYHGYSGSKDVPASHLHWALQGFNVFAVDTRGQNGDSPDNNLYLNGSAVGFMTKGIDDPQTYFYRFAYMDCVRAVQFVSSLPETGPIILNGKSQGGGLTLAVAALAKEFNPLAAMPDVPFLCHFERAVEVFSTGPYQELVNHWKVRPSQVEQHYRTLSYFDGLNFAPRITCPVQMSTGLLDTTCPPSTNFAVYNHLGSAEKEIKVYPFNNHEGGGNRHEEEKYRFIRNYLKDYSG
jgi:cephalosporin-C deacetylase